MELKATRILTLSDSRAERRALDAIWAQTLDYMLEQGMWNFAARAEELQPSDTSIPQYGYQYAFEKPDDYIRLLDISDNEDYEPTLDYFEDYGDYFLADVTPLYVNYVSNHYAYGGDPGKWKPTFAYAFALQMAVRAAGSIASLKKDEKSQLLMRAKKELTAAKGKDAVNQPADTLPAGRLIRARRGFRSGINAQRKAGYLG